MTNKNYIRGRRLEYRIKKHYEKLGYHVVRSYASRGPADLYCMKSCYNCSSCVNTDLLLVQAKNYDTTKRKFPKQEAETLKALARKTGGTPVLVSNINHRLHIEKL